MEASSIQFAAAARVLADAARSLGLVVPSFRSPPRVPGPDRTVRRRESAGATVAVRVRGRPWLAVLGDLIEGVVVANRLAGTDADRCRTELWGAVERSELVVPGAAGGESPTDVRGQRGKASATVATSPGWRKRQTQAA